MSGCSYHIVLGRGDFYPYGMPWRTPETFDRAEEDGTESREVMPDRYLFGGKEYLSEDGRDEYYFLARNYIPSIPRFDRHDPKAEDYTPYSPYLYCAGNPVNAVDPDGEEPTMPESARMCDHVYKDENKKVDLTGGWKKSNEYKNIDGFRLTDQDSGFKSELYERTINGVTEYAYVIAGTDISSIKDWTNNINQLAGLSKQYEIAMNNAEKLVSNFNGKSELTFLGHSLGGGAAAACALKVGGRAITFNPAGVSYMTVPFPDIRARIDTYIHYRDELNLIQLSHPLIPCADGKKHIIFRDASLMGHNIENFYAPTIKERFVKNVSRCINFMRLWYK